MNPLSAHFRAVCARARAWWQRYTYPATEHQMRLAVDLAMTPVEAAMDAFDFSAEGTDCE